MSRCQGTTKHGKPCRSWVWLNGYCWNHRAQGPKIIPTIVRNLLVRIRDSEEQELVYEKGGGWWVDDHQTSGRAALACIRLCLLRQDDSGGGMERYTLYHEAHAAIADPWYTPAIKHHAKWV